MSLSCFQIRASLVVSQQGPRPRNSNRTCSTTKKREATNADASNADARFGTAEIGALAHLYRGEMYRSKIWRTRLDATTNWAVVTTGIALSVAFSRADASPLPIVLVGLLVTVFLIYEARRYRSPARGGRLACGCYVTHRLDHSCLGYAPDPASRRTREAAEGSRSPSQFRIHEILSAMLGAARFQDLVVWLRCGEVRVLRRQRQFSRSFGESAHSPSWFSPISVLRSLPASVQNDTLPANSEACRRGWQSPTSFVWMDHRTAVPAPRSRLAATSPNSP